MYYPDELVEEVRMRNDIVSVISGYVRLQKKGSNYFGLCPFHNEKSPSFSVSPVKQMYYCFGCGAGGNVITFIMEYENYTFTEALQFLAQRAGISLPEIEYSEEARKKDDLKARILDVNKEAAKFYYFGLRAKEGARGLEYLTKRCLSEETIKKFGLGFAVTGRDNIYRYLKEKGYKDELLRSCGLFNYDERHGMSDKFWNRVIFPIMDVNHRVIGFGGRVMGDGEPKYLNSPETPVFDKGRNLYGLNHARTSRKKNMIICEGYMDVIALHQAGFNQAVASLGTAFTSGQANLLRRYTDEVLLTYDSDAAGIKAALRAIPILKEAGLSAKVIDMKPYKDPDEFIKNLGAEAFEERIAKAENSFYYEVRILEQDYDLKDPESKTKFCAEVAKKLLRFEEELERDNYIEAIADRFHLGFDNLRKMVVKAAAKEEMMLPAAKPKSGIQSKKDPQEGIRKSERMLLTWLTEEPKVYQIIKHHLSPEDFEEGIYHQVAALLFKQFEENQINPAKIISCFTNEEEQREVAALFNTKLEEIESKTEKEKAMKDLIINVKTNSLRRPQDHSGEAADQISELDRIIAEKKAIDELRRLHISLD
ncbi:MAG: DNA primase [Clostridia bacterium]|nr:DNA primase [Clostridia bacterium]